MKILKFGFFALFVFALMYCKESYQPELTKTDSNVLVVEGMINTGGDSTIIKLSRTTVIDKKKGSVPEANATVTVESNANESYTLLYKGAGSYETAALPLSSTKQYRLRIKTASGKAYVSDFVESRTTPPIDSIGWTIKDNGLQLYTSTHDVTNKSRYYRWDYYDTWHFTANYYSIYKSNGSTIVNRDLVTENVFNCWTSSSSSNIILGSSAKLSDDVIYQNPLVLIPSTSEKISKRYSILVRQYALTKEAFEFWDNLRKNTEALGSIFDAQPSQLTGNIHGVTNPAEPVIGYISAGTVQKKRIFVDKSELPATWRATYPYFCQEPDSLYVKSYATSFFNLEKIPIVQILHPVTGLPIGYTGVLRACADCTTRGSAKQPAFWR